MTLWTRHSGLPNPCQYGTCLTQHGDLSSLRGFDPTQAVWSSCQGDLPPFIYRYLLPALSQAGIRVHVPENTRAALSLHHLWGISWVSLEARLEGPVTKFRTSYLGKSPSSYPLTCDSTLLMSHFSHTASTFRSKLSPVFSLLYKTQTSFIPGYQHTHIHTYITNAHNYFRSVIKYLNFFKCI